MVSRGSAATNQRDSSLEDLAGIRTGDVISESFHKQIQELIAQASRDPLTGLANRRGLDRRLNQTFASPTGDATGRAIFLIDVDEFKSVNDRHGHPIGDRVLRAMARRLAMCVRETDLVARLGGDEFVVIADDVGERQVAVDLARRIRNCLRKPLRLGRDVVTPLQVTVSIGVVFDQRGREGKRLVNLADRAMYRAKSAGRNRLVIHMDRA